MGTLGPCGSGEVAVPVFLQVPIPLEFALRLQIHPLGSRDPLMGNEGTIAIIPEKISVWAWMAGGMP